MIDWSAVEIGEEHEAALRAYLAHGPEVWPPLQDELAVPQTATGYTQVIQAAFGVAVKQRFSPTYDIHQIIQYVADVRLHPLPSGQDLNPRVIEILIRRYLADPNLPEASKPIEAQDVEQETVALITLLFLLAKNAEHQEKWLDEFVQEAGDAAQRWIGGRR